MAIRILTGKVVGHKNNKTAVVQVERRVRHPIYLKDMRRLKKYHAHDENNAFSVGDLVSIRESRPISKLKRWVVVERVVHQG